MYMYMSFYGKKCTSQWIAQVLNPFAPEPPVTAREDPGPFYPL